MRREEAWHVGRGWGRNGQGDPTPVAAIGAAIDAVAAERRVGEMERRLLQAAIDLTGCDAGVLMRGQSVTVRIGDVPSLDARLTRALSIAGQELGSVALWGSPRTADAGDALAVLCAAGSQAIVAAEVQHAARIASARARRTGEAAAGIARSGGRSEALAAVLAHARGVLEAPAAAVLVDDRDGGVSVAAEEGVVGPGLCPEWGTCLPEGWRASASGGGVLSTEVPVGQGRQHIAVAELAHSDSHYGYLALAGIQAPDTDSRALVAEFAGRAAAAIWIAALGEEVRELTTIDPVTRLHDGRYFRQRLEQELTRAAREDSSLSLIVLEFDGIGELRSSGKDARADDALLDLAVHVGHTRRGGDVACRLAGDEIALILPNAAGLDAVLVAERIRAVAATTVSPAERRSLSAGIATFPDAGSGREELISAARSALAFARRHGGDRPFLYDREVADLLKEEEREDLSGDDAFIATVYALAAAVDARDASTQEHGHNVARLAALIAKELGLPVAHVEEVRTAGLLHDVGKIGVSDRVLRKKGPLTEEEWDEMRQHPMVAHRILAGTRLEEIRPWILHHHENVDGSGYPDALSGDEIPLEARIIAVAEAYDAMLQGRPYRPAVSAEAAMGEIAASSGTRFDPVVVKALQSLAARGEADAVPRRGASS